MNFRPTVAKINLDHLASNYRLLRSLQKSPEQFFCPMVKANAYGHGDIEVTKRLLSEGATHFGVATVEEGLRLRENLGLGFHVLVFAPLREEGVYAAVQNELTPVISSWRELECFEKNLYQKAHFKIHLEFNSGMSRLGFALSEAEPLARYLRNNDRFVLEGVCTHLAEGEDSCTHGGRTTEQLDKFFSACRIFRGEGVHLHALNSAALVGSWCGQQSNHLEFGARPGISLYGMKQELKGPSEAALDHWYSLELKPVMSLESRVVHTQSLSPGERVSYGGTWTSSTDTRIAVIPIGYADGLSRLLSNKGRMLIRGQWAPIVGTVCMDYTMLDVTALAAESNEINNEDVIVLGESEGRRQTAEDLARLIGTNSYEILTGISERVPRVYS